MSNIQEGTRFGRWTVVGPGYKRQSRDTYPCVCQCGTKRDVRAHLLTTGSSESCGCLRNEILGARSRKHGMWESPEFMAWNAMLARCNHHPDYRGRGITVCERWLHSFENFYADMGPRPGSEYSIDRIDNDGNYEPDNCRWTTWTQQARNRRTSRYLTYNGETLTMAEWAYRLGIKPDTLQMRLASGWPVEWAVTQPLGKRRTKKQRQNDTR